LKDLLAPIALTFERSFPEEFSGTALIVPPGLILKNFGILINS
jgi:hypothetical protein